MKKIMTIDLEPDLRSAKCKSMELVVPKLLDLFDDHKIKATFFTVTSLLEKYESEIKEIAQKHEIASHTHTHPWLNDKNVELEIKNSKEKLEEYGLNCTGFRAPFFVITKNHFNLLKKYDYKYDSSLGIFYPGRYSNLGLPQKPFFKKKFGVVEFPMPTFVYPAIDSGLSYLKLLHPVSKLFPQRYMFYLHPWEFLEKKDLPFGDSVVKRFLRRNSGQKAWKIFDSFVNREESKWVGCEGWMRLKEKKQS